MSQPLADSKAGILANGSNSSSQQLIGQWQTSGPENNLVAYIQYAENPHFSQMELMHNVPGAENQLEQIDRLQEFYQLSENCPTDRRHQSVTNPLHSVENSQVKLSEQDSFPCLTLDRSQHPKNQDHDELQLNNQPLPTSNQADDSVQWKVPIHVLIQELKPHLDEEKHMQLQRLSNKVKAQEITKGNFLRVCKSFAGDQKYMQAVSELRMQNCSLDQ